MKEVTKFEADDGKLLDTREECEDYEKSKELADFLSTWCMTICNGPDYYITLAQRIRTAFTVTPVDTGAGPHGRCPQGKGQD
jgi:hypothetical protein